eukprot:Pgem_evm1s9616
MKFQFMYSVATIAVAYSNPIGMITTAVNQMPFPNVVKVSTNDIPTVPHLPTLPHPQPRRVIKVQHVPPTIPPRVLHTRVPANPTRSTLPTILGPNLRSLTELPGGRGVFYTDSPEVKAYYARIQALYPTDPLLTRPAGIQPLIPPSAPVVKHTVTLPDRQNYPVDSPVAYFARIKTGAQSVLKPNPLSRPAGINSLSETIPVNLNAALRDEKKRIEYVSGVPTTILDRATKQLNKQSENLDDISSFPTIQINKQSENLNAALRDDFPTTELGGHGEVYVNHLDDLLDKVTFITKD